MKDHLSVKIAGGSLIPRYAAGLAEIIDLAVELERIGADGIVDSEHILFVADMHHPGGSGNVVHQRATQRSDRGDPFVMLAAVAARTQTLRLSTGVVLPAGRQFAVLAKQAATLDVISGGRFDLGIGSGWSGPEFAALGIDPKERDARLEETIRACRELWRPGPSTFEGRWIKFADVICEPAPLTPGGVPVWWGGNALKGRTAERVATMGAGWIAREAASFDEIEMSIESVRAACVVHGRSPEEVGFRTSITPTPAVVVHRPLEILMDEVVRSKSRLTALGVTHFTIPLDHYGIDLPELELLIQALR